MPTYEATMVSPEELFNIRASKEATNEANAYPTIQTGSYHLQIKKWDAKRYEDQRLIIRVTAEASQENIKKGTINFSISPELKRTSTGKPDKAFKLYAALQSITYPESKNGGENPTVPEVMSRAESFAIKAFVTETFKGDIDTITGYPAWLDAKTPEMAKEYREKGYKASNFVQSLGKV